MKKALCVVWVLCMAFALLPVAAADGSTPTVSGTDIYGNGTALIIMADPTDPQNTTIYIDADGDGELDDNEKSLYAAGVSGAPQDNTSLSGYTVYGGGTAAGTYNTKITMLSGRVSAIFGGGRTGATVTGSTYITINGGEVVGISGQYSLVGGGHEGAVTGSTNITVTGGTVGRYTSGANIFCGGREASATVGSTNITIAGGTLRNIYGGGHRGAVTGNSNITITGGDMSSVYGTGHSANVDGNRNLFVSGNPIINSIRLSSLTSNRFAIPALLTGNDGAILLTPSTVANNIVVAVATTPSHADADKFAFVSPETGYSLAENATNTGTNPKSVYIAANTYNVTHTLTNLTATAGTAGTGKATYNTAYTTTLTAAANYSLPTSVIVKVGGTALSAGYTYASGTGAVSVAAASVTDAIEIIADGVAQPAAHTHPVCGATCSHTPAHAAITYDKTVTATGSITASGNYVLTGDVTRTSGLGISGTGTVVNLCLNGHKLSRSNGGRVVEVGSGATLNLCDCNGSHGSHQIPNPATVDNTGDTVTITGGVITGSTNSGVVLFGTLNLYGGTIAGNTQANNGGGVNMSTGIFNMYGGSITANRAGYHGGGVGIYGEFAMYGGSISGNSAAGNGGGVYANRDDQTYYLYGGTISADGAAYAVYSQNGRFALSGAPVIRSGNTANADIYLNSFNTSSIVIAGALTNTAPYRVYKENATAGTVIATATTAAHADASKFSSANMGYALAANATDTPPNARSVYLVTPAISFTTQPAASTTLTVGRITASDTLMAAASVTPTGTPALNWYACDAQGRIIDMILETGGTFHIPTDLTAGTYYYLCEAVFSNALMAKSDVATVTVRDAAATPTITFGTHPQNKTVTEGSITPSDALMAAATVSPAGTGTATLNWYACNSDGVIDGGSIGSDGIFPIPVTLTAGTYYYLCQATFPSATPVDSDVATVTVRAASPDPTPPPGPGGYGGTGDISYAGNEYPGSQVGGVLTVQGPCERLTSVSVDHIILIWERDYTVNCGSTVITFTPAFLATLQDGEHTVRVQFTDGRYWSTFTTPVAGGESAPVVDAAAAVVEVPATNGGPERAAMFVWFLCGVCCLLTRMVVYKRREDPSLRSE